MIVGCITVADPEDHNLDGPEPILCVGLAMVVDAALVINILRGSWWANLVSSSISSHFAGQGPGLL